MGKHLNPYGVHLSKHGTIIALAKNLTDFLKVSYSWVSCDVINFSGVNSKSRHRHGSELNVHCMCWPRVS